jgi:hypothetical protein
VAHQRKRRAVCRLTAALVVVSLLRPAGAGGLMLLHEHCGDDLHVHVSGHNDLDAWRIEHAHHDPCDGHHAGHGPADADATDTCCTHDDPIVILVAIDLTAPGRTSAAKKLPLTVAAGMATLPIATLSMDIKQRARSPGIWRTSPVARSAVAAILVRNHALLF